MDSYRTAYFAAVTVAVLIAIFAAIGALKPEDLGLNQVVINWISKVILPGLGILAGILPSIGRRPDPDRDGMD